MATSQFTIYTAADTGGPGYITGTTGSLLTILDACLVNGYTGHTAAGWSTGSLTRTGSLAAYIPASGSRMTLFVNDMGPNVAAGPAEAWTVGYGTLTSLTSSNTLLITGSVGAGTGAFPTPLQLPAASNPLASVAGHLICRKSANQSTSPRYWIMFADAYTMYFFVQSGDAVASANLSATSYYTLMFGDIYSLRGSSDIWRCIIIGRIGENTSGFGNAISGLGAWYDTWDSVPAGVGASLALAITQTTANPMLANIGHYVARGAYGGGSSINVSKFGDIGKTVLSVLFSGPNPTFSSWIMSGNIQTPNSIDNSYYMSPIWIGEPSAYVIRGRMRGMFQVCHDDSGFYDGQIFAGSGDYAGKTFRIVKGGPALGFVAIETSATVETN